MRLGKFLFRCLIALLVLGAVGQWWLIGQAHDKTAQFAAKMVSHGKLKYERLWPWPWGSISYWDVSFVSDGVLGLSLQLPQGMRFEADRIDLQNLSVNADFWPAKLDAQVWGLRFEVPKNRSRPARSPDPTEHALPTLFELGYSTLQLDFDLEWRFLEQINSADLRVNLNAPDCGKLFLRTQLEGSEREFRSAPDQIVIRQAELDYFDLGLLQRSKSFAIARARLAEPEWREALGLALDQLEQDEKLNWDLVSAQSLKALLRDPSSLSATIEPPGSLLLRNVRTYPMADWPALLGFKLQAHTEFAHPPLGG